MKLIVFYMAICYEYFELIGATDHHNVLLSLAFVFNNNRPIFVLTQMRCIFQFQSSFVIYRTEKNLRTKFSVKPVDLSTENNSSKPDATVPRPYRT